MSRKAFLNWGLAIISFTIFTFAIFVYLAFSRILDLKSIGIVLPILMWVLPILAFGVVLHLRFRSIGRGKRTLAICALFYALSWTVLNLPVRLYVHFLSESGPLDHFFDAIMNWEVANNPQITDPVPLNITIHFILLCTPLVFLIQWGAFALLWYGSLDPRTPSKSHIVQFFKTGFTGKLAPNLSVKKSHVQEVTP